MSKSDIPPPRTDRRRVLTRSALIGAGQRLFAKKSLDGVTIDDIILSADVAKGSFYNHFDGKEGLADTIVKLVQGDCEAEVYAANLDRTDPVERVARAMGALMRYAREHPDRYHAMLNLTRRRAEIDAPINSGLRHDIRAGLAMGRFQGISEEAGMLAVFALISSAVDRLASRSLNAGVHAADAHAQAVIHEMGFMLLRALGVADDTARSAAAAAAEDFGSHPTPQRC